MGLFEWVDELQSKESHIPSHVLPQHPCQDRRSLAWNETIGGWRRGRDRQMDRLVRTQNMLGRNASPESTDIKGFSKLDKLGSGGVRAPNKHWNLQTNAGRVPC